MKPMPMCRTVVAALGVALAAGCSKPQPVVTAVPAEPPPAPKEETVSAIIKTSMGEIEVELFADRAPETVKNFLAYVDAGHFNGTIFHRVIDGFMIQGGGFTRDMRQKPTQAPVRNEAANRVPNQRGTLAMARTGDPHSASAQFFINVADNAFLNHSAPTPQGWGYCVFGRVTRGMEVVDRIKAVPTTTVGPFENVPAEPVEILSIARKPAS